MNSTALFAHPDPLLTDKEGCAILGIAQPTWHRWVQRGLIPRPVKLGHAKSRMVAREVFEVFDSLADAAEDAAHGGMSFAEEVAAARRPPEPHPRRPSPAPVIEATPAQPHRPAGTATPATPPAPILPRPEPRPYSGDWSPARAEWPTDQRQAFVDGCGYDTDPYEKDPFGFLNR